MERNLRKERIGVVVSNKMEKTIVVAVARKVKHPIYGKFVNKTTKFVAESLDETCKEGDTVRIMETRPLSNTCVTCRTDNAYFNHNSSLFCEAKCIYSTFMHKITQNVN